MTLITSEVVAFAGVIVAGISAAATPVVSAYMRS
jgi:hypothetical protein